MSVFRTRFAPSPTYYLHLGHAASALHVWRAAALQGGEVLLRIEDIDTTRCRPEYTKAIFEDLAWLGLDWPEPVRVQSQHFGDYAAVVKALTARGLKSGGSLPMARAGARLPVWAGSATGHPWH